MGRSEIDRPFFYLHLVVLVIIAPFTYFSFSQLGLVCGNHRSVFCCLIVFATIRETFLNVD